MPKSKKRYFLPAVGFWVLLIGAFLWLGWSGVVVAFVGFLVGGVGTAYNASKALGLR